MSEPRFQNEEAYENWLSAGKEATTIQLATGKPCYFEQQPTGRFRVDWGAYEITGLTRPQLYAVLAMMGEVASAAWNRPIPGSPEMAELYEKEYPEQ